MYILTLHTVRTLILEPRDTTIKKILVFRLKLQNNIQACYICMYAGFKIHHISMYQLNFTRVNRIIHYIYHKQYLLEFNMKTCSADGPNGVSPGMSNGFLDF